MARIQDDKKERFVYSHYRNLHAGYDETGGIASRCGILRSIAGRHTQGGSQAVVTTRNEWTSCFQKTRLVRHEKVSRKSIFGVKGKKCFVLDVLKEKEKKKKEGEGEENFIYI